MSGLATRDSNKLFCSARDGWNGDFSSERADRAAGGAEAAAAVIIRLLFEE